MSDEPRKRKPGRPAKVELRTLSQLNDVVLKVANARRTVSGPAGMEEKSFFELAVLNTSSDKAAVRIGAQNFVNLTRRAALEEEHRERQRANALRNRSHF